MDVIAYTRTTTNGAEGVDPMTDLIRPRLHPGCALVALVLAACAGCFADPEQPEVVWGKHGVQDGDLSRPRAIAIDSKDRLYIVDFTARIQVYDRDAGRPAV